MKISKFRILTQNFGEHHISSDSHLISFSEHYSRKLHILYIISVLLIFISVCTAVGAWTWLWDPDTSQVYGLIHV